MNDSDDKLKGAVHFEPDDQVDRLKAEILRKLTYSLGKNPAAALPHDWLTASILAARDHAIDIWQASTKKSYATGRKRVYYLSLEFLIGRSLADTLNNLGLTEPMTRAMRELGVDLSEIETIEPDAALGNGGLGRLAACYMEAMASTGVPALGYGIRYDHGLFKQGVENGRQIERPEDWLSFRNPWEFERREASYRIGFGGSLAANGPDQVAWTPEETVFAVAYDTPIIGWRGRDSTTLRLWRARAMHPLSLDAFNKGDLVGAVAERNRAEAISKVLYPNDSTPAGQELRLRQEFFFTSASLQDLVHRHHRQFGSLDNLAEKAAIQLNDTHPSLAVAELMRLLLDEHKLGWEKAWEITTATISYTNHTLLPEALETWPLTLVERLLPRHMQIIFGINARFLDAVRRSTPDADLASLSLIDEHHGRRVRMAHLAFVGSHTVNGVSALHSNLMKETVFAPLHRTFPAKITNVTNGITPRRWLFNANPGLTQLLQEVCGEAVADDIERIRQLGGHADDAGLQERLSAIRRENKLRLAKIIQRDCAVVVDTEALFDVQIKRIHEYKRQLLNILETIALYNAIRTEPYRDWAPRVKIFAGKAASNYTTAKSIINLINDVATVVNNDITTRDRLKVVFLPNYNVSLAELIIPAADLSEQISTAGMEASGTGNMKFALNGAITIGTLDGANIEIGERVGADNIVIFGMNADEVEIAKRNPQPSAEVIRATPHLESVLDAVAGGAYSPGERDRYAALVEGLRLNDWFMVLRDFESYHQAQRRVDALWADRARWWRMSAINTAHCAWFSADRAIGEYADRIWHVPAGQAARA
ncbi:MULTISPECIES: glycogen/starch/alpha-glucan phosphorylase [unclassified Bosea (in: a-proteobacteria)]|uniref:glycogen/starch/alpha-glucan phosphorylase n=1 Tax=unclassified Bosea (in: a-proteobacteria) TaxID=2653178 RepID=UPI001F37F07E|nr:MULTISPECIES: glycogen/starch/alpha-glucan phosphorylase [unclassified Bosea (in: a-proteobacteria)]